MRAALVLMIGMTFWLMTPALGEAHQVKQKNYDRNGYSQKQDSHRGYASGFRQHDRHHHKGWNQHRRVEKKSLRHARHQQPVRVVYRDRWPIPLFPRIVINIPL